MSQHLTTESLRLFVYDELLERSNMPTTEQIGEHFHVNASAAHDALRSTRIGKTLLVHPESGELWMAGPFSAVPTTYRVRTSAQSWFGNCAWDALGIAAMANQPVIIDARCADSGEPLTMHVSPGDTTVGNSVVHFLVPARRWYDDIGFT